MKRALVTGGAGFIGSHLVRLLLECGWDVRVLDRPAARLGHLPLQQIEWFPADIRDRSAVCRAVAGCDAVFHLAANPQLWTLRRGHFRQVNYLGTVNVLNAAATAGVPRIVHCSTESILTCAGQAGPISEDQQVPLSEVIGPYCRSKWYAERHAFALAATCYPVLIANPTLPVGPGDYGMSPPTQMLRDCAAGHRGAYLDAELNLIDVRDAALGLLRIAEVGAPGRRYLLGAENWSIRRLFEFVAAESDVPPPRFAVPYPLALGVAYLSELWADLVTHRIPAASVTGVKLTQRTMQFDASRSFAELGIQPRSSLEASVREALAWLRAR